LGGDAWVTKAFIPRNTIYSFSLRYHNKTTVFRDSEPLLSDSLETLGKNFETATLKGEFPYNFPTRAGLEYVGPHPITKEEGFDLRAAAIEQARRDCVCLHEVLVKVQSIGKELLGVDPLGSHSLASYANKI